ncbi:MAG: hypothetical protein K0Q95_795 [Bacteroidota bacterium]|jgi:hypothetical protein|nr:hypothetical protein [Bacteroidota bacterium]
MQLLQELSQVVVDEFELRIAALIQNRNQNDRISELEIQLSEKRAG